MIRALAIAASFLALISGSAADLPDVISEDVARFTVLLHSAAPERRVEGIQGLSHLKHWPAEDSLPGLLNDKSSDVRREALLALGRIGTAKSVPRLIELLNDSSWEVRENACLALRRMTGENFPATQKSEWRKFWNGSSLAKKQRRLLAVATTEHTSGVVTASAATMMRRGKRVRVPSSSASAASAPERREALRALRQLADPSTEPALIALLKSPATAPLDPDERAFICEALERIGSTNAIPVLAAQQSEAAAWALGRIGSADAERALLKFPPTLATLLALDRLYSTNAAPLIPFLVSQMGQITYRGQPDDVMNDRLQPIQRVGVNLIRRSGLAPAFIECALQELEDTMKPLIAHGAQPVHPAAWNEMFKRMRSELKPGFVREDGTTTSQPIVAMCYLLGDEFSNEATCDGIGAASSPSPLNGERAGVRGENVQRVLAARNAFGRDHPSPSIPPPVEGRGKPEPQLAQRLIALLHHPASVPRVYVALALGRMHATEALPAIRSVIDEGYTFSDSTALASGKHFDQSQTVRWRGFLCIALGRMGGDDARLALEEYVANPKQARDIRYGSVVGLRFIGSPKSLPVLDQVARDDVIWMVRDEAQRAAEDIRLLNEIHVAKQ